MPKFDFETKQQFLPSQPGCYLMKDRQGRIIYIGKAKNLKNRVRNYFQSKGDQRPFVRRLPNILGDIEVIITANEKEALILENTLIKRHKPRYNVHLKDDKTYASLRVDLDHPWPRVEVVRKPKADQARYFGPYSSGGAIRRTLKVLNKHFRLRTCTDAVLANRARPCLQYQIKRCPGPCVFDVDRQAYLDNVHEALLFLEGRGDELVGKLQERMERASEELHFELAATYRDQIKSIESVLVKQRVVTTEAIDRDAIGFYRQGERVLIQALFVRQGKLEGARSFPLEDQDFPDDEVLSSFLSVYYQGGAQIPDEVLLPMELPEGEASIFDELLTEIRGGKRVRVLVPKRGHKHALVETARANAENAFMEKHVKEERVLDLLTKLQNRLGLRNLPERIECYDISNLQGDPIVGSQVVFMDGEPAKKEYRSYKMRAVTSQDDFASMNELLERRLRRVAEGEEDAPDLLVIDGGKGQLGQAIAVLEDAGLADIIDVISLAKSRVDKSGFDDHEVTRSPERVFLPGRKNPLVLKQNSAELYLLQRVRDEAHRVAITFHKKLRRKKAMRSSLEEIPGIGQATRKGLLKHFGSLKKIKTATVEELQGAPGIGPKAAQAIRDHFLHDAP